jgi:hypothetical protein
MIISLKQFSTAELLTALSGFIMCLENETPNFEEQLAIDAVCAELERRRRWDSRDLFNRKEN